MSFDWRTQGTFSFLANDDLWNEGIKHGFTGSDFDFSNNNLDELGRSFISEFAATILALPTQVHGRTVLKPENLSSGIHLLGEADAIILRRTDTGKIYGVRSADCVPLILVSNKEVALVHAGWRGLACGVIECAIESMLAPPSIALIGPCAGIASYEVGKEVIDAIGSRSVYKGQGDSLYLSTSGTASRIIKSILPDIEILDSGICTIEDTRFHSFRRDKEMRGSNLAFAFF